MTVSTPLLPPEGTPYRDLYIAAGNTCPTISAKLLAAQGMQESGFNPKVKSHAGALGIAQFMPATWATFGNGGDPLNPTDAIPAQARFMCSLSQAEGHDLDRILAHYNGGPGAVQRLEAGNPWDETSGYIRSIRAIYSRWS